MTIQPHQQRVIDEHNELKDKLDKLTAFFDNPIYIKLEIAEQHRLKKQSEYMAGYVDILQQRIDNF